MYRASTNPPKTAWARHLDQVMRDRGWSRVRLFEEVGAELGYSAKSRSAMLPLLEDKEPNETQAAALRKHFGEPPPVEVVPEPPAADYAAVVAAIDRQTAMLERVLMALGATPPDPDASEALRDIADRESRLVEKRDEATRPLRRRDRTGRSEERAQESRGAGPA